MECRKVVLMKLSAEQQWRNRQKEWIHGHREKEGEDEMYGKKNMKTDITICKTDSQWKSAVCLRKPKQGFYINPERCDGEGVGGSFKREGIYVYL